MRKLVYSINLTLDGCCDHAKGIANEELHEFYAEFLREGDTFVYGRKTYELMVPFWPDMAKTNSGTTKALNDFAHAFNDVKQIVVFSRTLKSVDQKNATVVNGDLRTEIMKLKQQEGKDILTGGVDLASQLIKLGLIDEYCIVIQPIIVGEGRRLFDNIVIDEKLKLIDKKIFKSGFVALRYNKQ